MRTLVLAVVVLAAGHAFADSLTATGLALQDVPMLNPGGGAHNLIGPTDLRYLPDGRMVIVEKAGAVKLRARDGTVTTAYRFCVSTSSEQGLLGVEVDPDFDGITVKRLFFYYSNCAGDGGSDLNRHRVVSIDLGANGLLDPSTEKVLLQNLIGPQNHDGGGLAIGPDRKLYVGVGDTGCNRPCCPALNHFTTCLSNANGKLLRINLDGTIPNDNPWFGVGMQTACGTGAVVDSACTAQFAAVSASNKAPPRTEIWALGLRNPWRFWFDTAPGVGTGKLWLGDVGETGYEEIDIIQKGKHYGYPWFEGAHGGNANQCETIVPGTGNCVPPIAEYPHVGSVGNSITSGVIVDHPGFPAQYRGQFFFGDNATGDLSVLHLNATRDGTRDGGNAIEKIGVFTSAQLPASIRLGNDGVPYYVRINVGNTNGGNGRITRIVPTGFDGGFAVAANAGGSGTGGGTGTGGGSGGSGGGAAGGAGTAGGTGTAGGSANAGGSGTAGGSGGTGGGDVEAGGCHCSSTGDLASLVAAVAVGVTVLRRRRMMRR